MPGSTRGTWRWSTERQETGCAYTAQQKTRAKRVAPLGSQALCLELIFQGEHLSCVIQVIQTWSDPNQSFRVSREPSRQ